MIMDQICMPVPKFGVLCNGNFGGAIHDIYSRSSESSLVAIWPCQQSRVMVGDDTTNTPSEVGIEHLRRDCKDVAAVVAAKLGEKFSLTQSKRLRLLPSRNVFVLFQLTTIFTFGNVARSHIQHVRSAPS